MVFVVYYHGDKNGVTGVYSNENDAVRAWLATLIPAMHEFWKQEEEEPCKKLASLLAEFAECAKMQEERFGDLCAELLDASHRREPRIGVFVEMEEIPLTHSIVEAHF